jgi:CD63 antigen
MGLSCGMSMVKYGLFVFNFITALAGIALIVSGSIALVQIGDISDAFHNMTSPTHMPIALIVLGSVIFIVSFFGCCGAIRESQCMVTTYAIFLLLVVIGMIICASLIFVYKDDVVNETHNAFNNIFLNRVQDVNRRALDNIQRSLRCCGRIGPEDFLNEGNQVIPSSCCDGNPSVCDRNNNNLFTQGCNSALEDLINGSSLLLAWISLGFGLAMFIGTIFACCLANSIRNVNRR